LLVNKTKLTIQRCMILLAPKVAKNDIIGGQLRQATVLYRDTAHFIALAVAQAAGGWDLEVDRPGRYQRNRRNGYVDRVDVWVLAKNKVGFDSDLRSVVPV
jgi:hypothetical protein